MSCMLFLEAIKLILFVTGIMKMSIVLISGSSCLDDGTPRKDAAEGEYTPTVGMFHF